MDINRGIIFINKTLISSGITNELFWSKLPTDIFVDNIIHWSTDCM